MISFSQARAEHTKRVFAGHPTASVTLTQRTEISALLGAAQNTWSPVKEGNNNNYTWSSIQRHCLWSICCIDPLWTYLNLQLFQWLKPLGGIDKPDPDPLSWPWFALPIRINWLILLILINIASYSLHWVAGPLQCLRQVFFSPIRRCQGLKVGHSGWKPNTLQLASLTPFSSVNHKAVRKWDLPRGNRSQARRLSS